MTKEKVPHRWPAKVWKTLPELKPRPLPPPSISDEAEEKKASAAEDIEQPESNLQISDYELSRLDKIKANNQDLGTRTVGFLGPGCARARWWPSRGRPPRAQIRCLLITARADVRPVTAWIRGPFGLRNFLCVNICMGNAAHRLGEGA